ncbi:hypothetical protein HZS61_008631 [Fusarium oxysporum f. sp. conglutinans]|uniref:HAT C-terminal dimerisation domain-containing protein n=2 Tax=Fusarium oxysporum TaxID=5507 RepID=A0A8H6H0Y7_FUSOX|nr:hypothetical protein HZS61_008631 [Fusarium oxysporum f. sp. conglutinans]KAH7459174.1 hypothetical protein FOMA001_g20230 [Fusarium oxysporum f. sp. matthiolae]KAH7462287.1 hypothetical protein FOMA001_g18737 [Fusarium oxysporum f. sp. matthiolae]KAH7462946.1 hypothetical protein FOMA001_g18486 [Fusarium oxysporum f. sp. matthiolae]KAH7483542.1 hypothetical protein FOMA001_g7181 [Fusarium oxysporum f. sp. matthiolae]
MSILSDSDAITAVDDDGNFRSSPAPSTAFTPFSPARRSKSTSPDSTTKERQYEESLWRRFPGFTWSQRVRDTNSWAWEYGYDIQKGNDRKWVCKICIRKNTLKPKTFTSTGIQNTLNHLYDDHRICAPEGKTKSASQLRAEGRKAKGQSSIAELMKLDTNKPREQAIANGFIKNFDKKHFQRLLMEWIVEANLSFETAEHDKLRKIFAYLNPCVKLCDANLSATSIRRKIVASYEQHKTKVMEVLQSSPGLIHVSFDGWRSGNRHALYGIMCFFQDEKNKPRKIVLGVPEVSTRHSGTNIAAEVLEIIDSYGIKNKIGYFTLDNAENNDSAMAVIGGELGFDGRKRRGRCFGHILNLSAKALLFGSNPEAFENQLSGAAALSETEHDLWRRRGPVGKLHNLVVDIDRSDVLSYLLRGVQQADMDQSIDPRVRARKPLNIVVDNDTRWLSQLYMIRRAIKLRPYLDVMILKHKQAWEQDNRSKRTGLMRRSAVQPRICLSENQLSNKDWDVLEHLATILGFYEVTVKTLEGDGIQRKRKRGWVGSYGNIWDVIQGFEFLMAKLEEYKAFAADYPDPEHFRININLGWQKLNKYYTILDETPIYYVALALHPAYRWGWFEEHWGKHPDWIATAKEMVQDVWETEYRNLEVVLSPGNEPVAKRRRKYQNAFEEYCEQSRYEPSSRLSTPTTTPARMRSSATPESPRDEYEAWQQSWVPTDTDIRDPIAYWQDNRAQYPRLSRMALDFLTIQPMSAECERLFSAAGRLVTPLRSRLEVDIIGMCLVLRSWIQAKIIDDLDPLFVPTQIKVESSARSEAGARESMASFLGRARELAEEEKGWE